MPEVTCRKCRRPIDEAAFAMVRKTCEERWLPERAPTVCTACMCESLQRRGDKEE
jgi:hypothetical protein